MGNSNLQMLGRHFSFNLVLASLIGMFAATGGIATIAAAVIQKSVFVGCIGVPLVWFGLVVLRRAAHWTTILPIARLTVEHGTLRVGRIERRLDEIRSLTFSIRYTKKSVNGLPSGTDVSGLFRIDFADCAPWKFYSGVGLLPLISGTQGAESTKSMVRKVSLLSQRVGIEAVRVSYDELLRYD